MKYYNQQGTSIWDDCLQSNIFRLNIYLQGT